MQRVKETDACGSVASFGRCVREESQLRPNSRRWRHIGQSAPLHLRRPLANHLPIQEMSWPPWMLTPVHRRGATGEQASIAPVDRHLSKTLSGPPTADGRKRLYFVRLPGEPATCSIMGYGSQNIAQSACASALCRCSWSYWQTRKLSAFYFVPGASGYSLGQA